ncbi:TIGR03364 family FAD-dependent oxidoreductase [Nocardioides sp. W7]|uniref:TIGR03364 family FAD-dependent oxidoreductase n=1 Tax=Nocardioides sp. W7 TaxID=2931390 RepID=UPI001FD308BB|nr:TIGR03364 family FAD-dependent oxidoreductase [Nocardioides sp. W7]
MTPPAAPTPDLVVVGAGIVGLAHAAEAVERGLRVTVLDRDEHAVGASVRNFGHVCTTAQSGEAHDLALVARERWLRLSSLAGFEVSRAGTLVVARTAAELGVLEELAASRGSSEVVLLTADAVAAQLPGAPGVVGGAHLPLDLRLDPRAALPALAAWLRASGVELRWGTSVGAVHEGGVLTSSGEVAAPAVVVAVGHDLDRLLPGTAAEWDVRRCRLQMLEVAPPGGRTIEPAVLTGTSMLRYGALAAQPSAHLVRREIESRAPELLEVVMNLMLTQRPDGSIVLGDTHHYARTHQPFDDERLADLLLREGARLLGSPLTVRRRWRGVYADSPQTDFLVAAPYDGVRAVAVISGIGMTTALGLAPVVLDGLLG